MIQKMHIRDFVVNNKTSTKDNTYLDVTAQNILLLSRK